MGKILWSIAFSLFVATTGCQSNEKTRNNLIKHYKNTTYLSIRKDYLYDEQDVRHINIYLQIYSCEESNQRCNIKLLEISNEKDNSFPYFKYISTRSIQFIGDSLLLYEKDSIKLNIQKGKYYNYNSKFEICLDDVLTRFKKHQIEADTVMIFKILNKELSEDDISGYRIYYDKKHGIILKTEKFNFIPKFLDKKVNGQQIQQIVSIEEIVQEIKLDELKH